MFKMTKKEVVIGNCAEMGGGVRTVQGGKGPHI